MHALKQFLLAVWEILEVVLIAAATVFIIRTFLIQPFLVSGASMEPNFSNGNYLLIDEITYRFREPERGEVVVFRSPQDGSTFFIKRIVGLPDEIIAIKNNQIFIDGQVLEEDYLAPNVRTAGLADWTLEADEYFVLGDNRFNSFDSRNWGPLNRKQIIGVARLRLLPVNEFEVFGSPMYN